MKPRILSLSFLLTLTLALFYAPDALAAGDALINKGHGLLDFLSHKLGPIIVGLGLIGGAASLALGIPGAVQKILGVVVGGVIITSVSSIISMIQSF